jgi:hypothetical protein
MGWMSHQLALLSYFHSELEKPNPSIDLEQKILAAKASAEKQIQALLKEQDALKASQAALREEISIATSNFNQLKLDNTKLSDERKELQVFLAKAQEEVAAIHLENSHLSRARDQQTADKAALEAENDKLKGEIQEQAQLISSGAYMAFSSCLKQGKFLNPGIQLMYKGIHPLHGVEGSKLLDYDNDPPTIVDLNDPELEAFDPHAHHSISAAAAEDEEVTPPEARALVNPCP